jgi:hypothetical protein
VELHTGDINASYKVVGRFKQSVLKQVHSPLWHGGRWGTPEGVTVLELTGGQAH